MQRFCKIQMFQNYATQGYTCTQFCVGLYYTLPYEVKNSLKYILKILQRNILKYVSTTNQKKKIPRFVKMF